MGVVHAVLQRLCPAARVIDLTHHVPRQQVRWGALCLARAMDYLGPGLVLAVVDPGVGTKRRPIAARAGNFFFVAPDNGLIIPAARSAGGVKRAVVLDRSKLEPARAPWSGPERARGATFDGRDVFAPAIAALAAGADLYDLGDPLDPEALEGLEPPRYNWVGECLETEVSWVDIYGNVQVWGTREDLERLGGLIRLSKDGQETWARVVSSFADLDTGEIGLLMDSDGRLAIVANGASAASALELAPGDLVWLCRSPQPS